nr:hypothetical protein KK1_019450 [Cajanus cajan]
MEKLGYMIREAMENGSWQPIQVGWVGPKLSHLFFADDVLLFTKAKASHVRAVTEVLHQFCADLGLKVSLVKSKVFASKGVTPRRRNKISNITHIQFTRNLGKYLGYDMVHGRVSN